MSGVKSKVEGLIAPILIVAGYYFLALLCSELPGMTPVYATIAANILVLLAYGWAHVRKTDKTKPKVKLNNKVAFIAIGLLFAVWFTGQMAAAVVSSLGDVSFVKYQENVTSDGRTAMLVLFFLAPFAEEVLMRRCVYDIWRRRINPWFALIASSALFAAMHGTLTHAIPTFLMGVLVALVYEYTHSVAYPIGFHLAYNLTAVIFGGVEVPAFFGTLLFAFGGSFLTLMLLLIVFKNVIGGKRYGEAKSKSKEAYFYAGAFEEDARRQDASKTPSGADIAVRGISASEGSGFVKHSEGVAECGSKSKKE